MIHIDLAIPIVTIYQEEKLTKGNPDIDKDIAHRLNWGIYGIYTEDTDDHKKFDMISLKESYDPDQLKADHVLAGQEGFIWYCHELGSEVHVLHDIDLTGQLYDHCSGRQWLGISEHARGVERRNDSLKKMLDLGDTPIILIADSIRKLRRAIDGLERNPIGEYGQKRWRDGTLMRCLKDVGYSLDDGWSPAMQKIFDKEQREFDEWCDKSVLETREIPEEINDEGENNE